MAKWGALKSDEEVVTGGGAHAASHGTGQSDAVSPASIGASASDHAHTGTYEPADADIQTHIGAAHAPATAEQNVNADWDASSGDAQILNKPTLAAMAGVADAPSDGSIYGRKDGAWAAGAGGLTLADVYPVGSIYLSVVATSPATLFGFGTWAAIGAGKVLVGQDAGDTDFDTLEETGGAKTVASSAQTFAGTQTTTVVNHVHVQNYATPATGNFTASSVVDTSCGGTGGTPGVTATAISTANPTGGAANYTPAGTNTPGSATSVVQPYVVVKMWKRTA